MKLYEKNAAELSAMLQKKECSAVELTQDVLERIEEKSAVGAYVTRCEDCLDRAKAVDDARAAGKELHPLAGIPIGIKDNISTKGIRTTCSSKMLGNYVPPFDATVMQPVREAGMVITGKMNHGFFHGNFLFPHYTQSAQSGVRTGRFVWRQCRSSSCW